MKFESVKGGDSTEHRRTRTAIATCLLIVTPGYWVHIVSATLERPTRARARGGAWAVRGERKRQRYQLEQSIFRYPSLHRCARETFEERGPGETRWAPQAPPAADSKQKSLGELDPLCEERDRPIRKPFLTASDGSSP